MTSTNLCILSGIVGRRDTKQLGENRTVSNIGLATYKPKKNADGTWGRESHWHNIAVWDIHPKILPMVDKGATILVQGRLETQEWLDKASGQKRQKSVVVCSGKDLVFQKPAQSKPQAAPSAGSYTNGHQPWYQQQQQPQRQQSFQAAGHPPADDIPF